MSFIISGIQQIGIGNPNVQEAFKWYRQHFGMDVKIFEEAAEANLMLPYTGGMPHQRHAILAINLMGGGGFEIWQYTSRTPQACPFEIKLGDLGFCITKMKAKDVYLAYESLRQKNVNLLSEITKDINGKPHFYLKDLNGNLFEVMQGEEWFNDIAYTLGGPSGVVIGVSNIEKSMEFYKTILGYDQILSQQEGVIEEWKNLPGGTNTFRRVVLTHSKERQGSFSELLGKSYIELVEVKDRVAKKIFEGRFWGDLGFIHLCFDIKNMAALKTHCEKNGHPFTVDSGQNFDMGEAAGHFSYIEDPDGALIEFVETFKIPIMKKWGWYLDLRKRDPAKRLPRWLLKALKFNRVKG